MAAKRKVDAAGLPLTDGLRQFQKAVQDLKNKSQSKITALTALADSLYAEAQDVAVLLVDEIINAKVERLQPLVSVVDSILKKVGKDYKTHLSEQLPQAMMTAYSKSEPAMHNWLKKMVNDSWRKYDLLPVLVVDQLDIALSGGTPAGIQAEAPTPVAVPAAAQVPEQVPHTAPPGPTPPMKAPPPQKPAPDDQATQAPRAAAPRKAPATTQDSSELVERRLTILSKIIERKSPGHEELREIMEVPQVRRAISMQQKGDRQQAMALLSEFKAELERKHSEAKAAGDAAAEAVRPRDPRQAQAFKPMDPRQLDLKTAADPRAQAAAQAEAKPADPRQAARLADPQQAVAGAAQSAEASAVGQAGIDAAAGKHSAEAEAAAGQAKQQRVDAAAAAAPAGAAAEDEEEPLAAAEEQSIVPARQVLHGLSSLGFSETWLRQFMEQMPTKKARQGQDQKLEAPSVGRKVIGASGEQLVYVDELTHSEMLLLMQFIFMLEDKAKRGGIDLTQRIPHTFSYLQVEPAIDVMLKRLFGELPHQCDKTGLRFATTDRLKQHHDKLYRKKQILQSKQQHGAEARGWMESVPEWVGNRDLIVGPALFRMGESADEAQKAKQEELSKMQAVAPEEEEDQFEGKKWICPFDERRSICPISGEALPRTWSAALNDWAFCDTVAVEIGEKRPLHFPPGGPSGPHGLSETAVLMKQSCFFNTPTSQQLEALRECCSVAAVGGAADQQQKVAGSAAFAPVPRKMDAALAALAAPRQPAQRFF